MLDHEPKTHQMNHILRREKGRKIGPVQGENLSLKPGEIVVPVEFVESSSTGPGDVDRCVLGLVVWTTPGVALGEDVGTSFDAILGVVDAVVDAVVDGVPNKEPLVVPVSAVGVVISVPSSVRSIGVEQRIPGVPSGVTPASLVRCVSDETDFRRSQKMF